jgi:PKD repeat protein
VLSFYVSAKDPSGKAVTYGIKNMPTYATFSGGKFTWRPTFDQQGTYIVTFTASNGTQTTSMDVQITVVNLDRAPILYAIGSKSVTAGSRLSFSVKANEPDNSDTLVFSASPLPSGATFTSGAYGTFTWTPTAAQRGTYNVTFKVSDGEMSDSEVVAITVN